LSGRGLCDELITHPEESYRLWCVVVCDLETSRIGAPYIYNISNLRVNKNWKHRQIFCAFERKFFLGILPPSCLRSFHSGDEKFFFDK
jgi:hypothetical protein